MDRGKGLRKRISVGGEGAVEFGFDYFRDYCEDAEGYLVKVIPGSVEDAKKGLWILCCRMLADLAQPHNSTP